MFNLKKTLTLAAAATTLVAAAPAIAQDTGATIGFIGGFTGPIESLTPPIFAGAELVVKQVNEQGGILGGELNLISADGACDATAAAAAADKLINTDNVTGIVGALCTGETIGAFNGSGLSGGVVFISPASSAPALTTLEDNDLVYRTTPSDALQGVKLANLLLAKGITDIAVTYVNNDYGKGFAEALEAAYTAGGGTVAANVSHEDSKADYRAELGNLVASQNLVILAYANSSGNTILRQAVESGNFTTYIGGDGMVGDDLLTGIDAASVDGLIATRAGAPSGEAVDIYNGFDSDGFTANATYAPQAYDAAFLMALAIEKNGSASREGLSAALREVASAPGEKILPGEWSKAVELIKAGTDIDYEGAGGVLDFDAAGDVDGIIVELTVEGGKFVEKGLID
ncbi:ABC transporter substrate-binding protein [Devosia sp. J2-20]|jgi:branched-chain amino acid transport system substrate-binding protein|uniref:ABC transporter substrate-binding protein n=1 Tax=Devosia litorisediminis TaxID=2829817 RepID=A0A942EF75_9HYPH|nr:MULTISPECIES: ABC transporter substrate-binding protein [Devosia]MBS3850129.1 ABC transporter substrate-binding protein [Devosia litorisediminis]MCZ4347616.1 ABC transporter substrate-binding protein [Devosia neptuniae]WDQ99902.1 ABC transporter substrate-binding protein [Devosia sp. J2-20]|tara:strand:+ start:107511 stop:108713 length:1203 start_codon:yes stop_codon:yes gene_type:complete